LPAQPKTPPEVGMELFSEDVIQILKRKTRIVRKPGTVSKNKPDMFILSFEIPALIPGQN
jgi:hypothetical protein